LPSKKITFKVDETLWKEMNALAEKSHQNISDLLNDAIRDFLRERRVRPEVLKHLEASITENEKLGRLLAD
jgi:predicted transcriptional regulator